MAEGAFNLVRFYKGAYIAMEGQPGSNEFYIIKEGKVKITSSIKFVVKQSPDGSVLLGPGDFFGVIPCMAKRPNLETISAVENTIAIVVTREKFSYLIQNNTAIALKIIRYFSQMLRYYDAFLPSLMTDSKKEETVEDSPERLYEIGEYYLSKKANYSYAGYAFTRYIQLVPDGEFVEKAKGRLQRIDKNSIKMEAKKEGNAFVYDNKQIIFLQGEPGNALYVIQEGEVKITRYDNGQEVLLDVLKKGDIFGEMGIIENKPRNANAFASGKVKVMFITRENFDFVVKNYPAIVSRIIELLSDRIWIIYRQMVNMLISNPEIKLFDALYTQLLKNRVDVGKKKTYTFDFGPEDLLKFTGLYNEEGWNIWKELRMHDKNIDVSPQGKIVYSDVSQIEGKINVIRREKEIMRTISKREDNL